MKSPSIKLPSVLKSTGLFAIISGAFGIIGLCINLWGGASAYQNQHNQSVHLASLAYIDAALRELATINPERLTSDDTSFKRFREINTAVMERLQQVKYGSVLSNGQPILVEGNFPVTKLLENAEKLLKDAGKMIQSRQDIHQYHQFKRRLESESEALIHSANESLAVSEQQSLSPLQLKNVYRLTQRIKEHHYQIQLGVLALTTQGGALITATEENRHTIEALVLSLTNGKERLSNPILRRMFVNILDQLNQHYNTVRTIVSATKKFQTLTNLHNKFTTSLTPFLASLTEINQQLVNQSFAPRLSYIFGGFLSCIGFFCSGLLASGQLPWLSRHIKNIDSNTVVISNNDSEINTKENTQQRNRNITEKNQLINDMESIIDGMLYIDANESSETTGDIARVFNHARRSVAKRIQLIQQELERLERMNVNTTSTVSEEEPPTTETYSPAQDSTLPNSVLPKTASATSLQSLKGTLDQFDIKSCVDITFDTQAKIERLQHQKTNKQEHYAEEMAPRIDAIMECQDHLRVRLRDLQQLIQHYFAVAIEEHAEPSTLATQKTKYISGNTQTINLERLSQLIRGFQLKDTSRSRKQSSEPDQDQKAASIAISKIASRVITKKTAQE